MAFSAEQKARIKKRAEELIASDPNLVAGAAAQQAVNELFSPEEIEAAFAPVEAPEPVEPIVETRSPDIQELDVKLSDTETRFVRERARQIEATGVDRAEAERQARAEVEAYREPAPLGFGTAEERRQETGGLFAAAPVQDTPIGKQQGPSGIDYTAVGELFSEAYGESKEDGLADAEAFRQFIVEPRLEELKKEGLVGNEAQRQALQEGFAVLEDIQTRIEDKSTYLQPEQVGSGDPLIRTFSRQVELGEGVPNLTPQQVQFINARERRRIQRLVESKKDETTTVVVLADGTELPKQVYEAQVRAQPELGEPVSEKQVPKTAGQIRLELGEEAQIPWYLDPQKKVEVIADPEAFEKQGILTSETPYGTKRETGANWLLRSALTIPNIVAGAAAEIAYPAVGEAREEKRKEKGMPEGIGGAILTNVAENRGVMGEAQEAAELAGVKQYSPALYYTTLAGGFAGDILDPSLDVIKAVGVAGKSGTQAYRATGALYNELGRSARAGEAAKIGARLGARDFLDSNLIGNLVGKNFDAGDVRGIIARNLTDDYASVIEANRIIDDIGDPSVDEVIEVLTEAGLQDSNWSRRYIAESRKMADADGTEVYDQLRNFFKNDKVESELQDLALGFERGADKIPTVRTKDLARTIGALAKTDPEIQRLLRTVDIDSTVRGQPKIVQMTRKLIEDPRGSRLLVKGLAADRAARDVVKATKGMDVYDNLVALTPNTWAGRGAAKNILKAAGESDIGQVAKQLAGQEPELVATADKVLQSPTRNVPPSVTGQGTQPRIQPAYRLDRKQAQVLEQITNEGRIINKLGEEVQTPILDRLGKNIITVNDLRILLDAQIDLIAEGKVITEGLTGVTRARDLARLPVGEQLDILQPLESRFFSRPFLRRIVEKLRGAIPKPTSLSIGQRGLLKRASAEAAALDQKLVRLLKQAEKDPKIRELYGIPEGATRQEILGYLIVGPRETAIPYGFGRFGREAAELGDTGLQVFAGETQRIKRTMDGLMAGLNDIFYSRQTRENIFDALTGTKTSTNSGIFTDDAIVELGMEATIAAQKISENPSIYFEELLKLAKKAEDLISTDPRRFMRIEPDELINTLAKEGKLPAEAQIAAYYRAETQRIVEDLLSELTTKEIGKGQINPENLLDPNYVMSARRKLADFIIENLGFEEFRQVPVSRIIGGREMNMLVESQLKKLLAGEDLELTDLDIMSLIGFGREGQAGDVLATVLATMRQADEIVGTSTWKFLEPLQDAATDIARGIIRRNGLRNNDINVREMEQLFERIRNKGDVQDQLKVLFGEDVAQQLFDSFSSGFQKLRKQLIDLQAKKYDGTLPAQGAKVAQNIYEGYTNALYTLLLNLRPRFHGANLLTGMDIAYATTGKIVNPLDVLQGAKVIRGKDPSKVMFTDPAGRPYTQGELQGILQDVTGRSVFGLTLPQAESKRLINLLDESTPAKIREGFEVFKELPQSEDLLFRYAILKQALMEGRSLDEAIELARRSMFDAGNITTLEKQLKNLALFYGFQRNNLINTLKNITSVEGIKRIGKAKRARDNLSRFFVDEETEEYSPDYTKTRVLLGKIGFDPDKGKELIIAGPPLASLDGVYTLAQFIQLEPAGVLGGAIRPEYKALFGVEDKFDREFKQIPAEHIAILDAAGFAPADVMNMIVVGLGGEEVIPVPGTAEEGAVNGMLYPLNTPKQRKAYKKFYDSMSALGLSTPIMDLSRTLVPEGTKVGETGLLGQIAFGTGAATPMTYISPEKQAYYDRLSRLRDLQGMVSGVAEGESRRLEKEAPVEEKQKAKEIQEKKTEVKQQKKIKPTRKQRSMLELKRAKDKIIMDVRSGRMTPSEGRARLEDLKREYESLRR